jgi:Fur family transcriptional regulator, ferric uptake regulator
MTGPARPYSEPGGRGPSSIPVSKGGSAALTATRKAVAGRVSAVLDALSERGMRRTAARQTILEELFSTSDHLTAEDLAARVQRRFPSVDVSTVYRTLDVLEGLEIVDHIHLAHGPAVFHLAEDDHHHLVCERCGRVEELPAERLRSFARMLRDDFGFHVQRRHFAIVGVCSACEDAS